MTRMIVYSAALVAFAGATGMSIATNFLPNWLGFEVTASNTGSSFTRSIGLHESCSSLADPPCRTFPHEQDCRSNERFFCSMWRSIGFLMACACVIELTTLVGFAVIMTGGKFKREAGWKILSWLFGATAMIQFVALAFVAYLFDNDDQFVVPGWRLDTSWILCTVSACISLFCAIGLAVSAFALPPEDGYEFLEDPEIRPPI